MDELPALMTVEELRRYLRVSRTTAYAMVNRGDVPVVRIGRGRIRIPKLALVRQLTIQTPGTRDAGPPASTSRDDANVDGDSTAA
jgi:excisionase family DNA binding protein